MGATHSMVSHGQIKFPWNYSAVGYPFLSQCGVVGFNFRTRQLLIYPHTVSPSHAPARQASRAECGGSPSLTGVSLRMGSSLPHLIVQGVAIEPSTTKPMPFLTLRRWALLVISLGSGVGMRLWRSVARVLSGAVLTVLVAAGVYAQGTAGVSTGQGLPMGATDPYWHYIMGQVDYDSPRALLEVGGTAVVDTIYNWGFTLILDGQSEFPWALRSRRPGLNVNNGWLHPPRPVWNATPLGPTTMRTFVDLTNRNLKTTQIAGTTWSDGKLVAIYVNGQALADLDTAKTLDQSRKEGYTFSISQADGLEPGVNVVDFVWDHFNTDHWLCLRVDFQSIFRETYDR